MKKYIFSRWKFNYYLKIVNFYNFFGFNLNFFGKSDIFFQHYLKNFYVFVYKFDHMCYHSFY